MNEAAANASAIYRAGIVHRLNLNDRENKLNLLSLENRDLTWEKMYELNVGAEVAFLKDRISATVDVYQRNTFDLIDLADNTINTPTLAIWLLVVLNSDCIPSM